MDDSSVNDALLSELKRYVRHLTIHSSMNPFEPRLVIDEALRRRIERATSIAAPRDLCVNDQIGAVMAAAEALRTLRYFPNPPRALRLRETGAGKCLRLRPRPRSCASSVTLIESRYFWAPGDETIDQFSPELEFVRSLTSHRAVLRPALFRVRGMELQIETSDSAPIPASLHPELVTTYDPTRIPLLLDGRYVQPPMLAECARRVAEGIPFTAFCQDAPLHSALVLLSAPYHAYLVHVSPDHESALATMGVTFSRMEAPIDYASLRKS